MRDLFGLALLCSSCLNVKQYGQELIRSATNAKYLNAHNELRKLIGADPLEWDETLEKQAMDVAKQVSRDCISQANKPNSNVYQSWGSVLSTPKEVVYKWAKAQKQEYKLIMSKRTIAVGCAFSLCSDEDTLSSSAIHICKYRSKSFLDGILK